MLQPLFFSQNTMMLEKLSLFSKIPKKLTVFQYVYDYHLILGGKQRLKQVKSCFMIPQPSFDTHQRYKHAMIREVLRVLSLFCNFFNDEATFRPVSKRFKDTNECNFNVLGINTTISIHYQSKFVKKSKSYTHGLCLLARFLRPISKSVHEVWYNL